MSDRSSALCWLRSSGANNWCKTLRLILKNCCCFFFCCGHFYCFYGRKSSELRGRSAYKARNSRCQDYCFVDVIRGRALSDLQFLGKTGINKDSFGLFFSLHCCGFPTLTLATRMGLMLPCILLLSVSTFTAGSDFQQGSGAFGQSVFNRHARAEEKAAKIVKRSLPQWLAASPNHKIKRRSIDQDDSCKALRGFDSKLADNTHRVSYPTEVLLLFARLTPKEAWMRRC